MLADSPTRPQPRSALDALTAAALLLPGLACLPAQAEREEGVAVQAARYSEAARPLAGMPKQLQPLSANTLRVSSNTALPDGRSLLLNYTQDTWSGASPITTAPAVAQGNRPILAGGVGQLVVVGASPMINGRVLLDARDQPLQINPATGRAEAAPALVHTLSSASPETRQQLDFKLSHRTRQGAWTMGAGVSVERDYRSRFLNLAQRLDLDEQRSTLSLGFSASRSDIAAALDHDAAPYITKTAYQDQLQNTNGQQVLRGTRHDWAASLAWTQVLSPRALLQARVAHTHSSGHLANPYKVMSVIFAPGAGDVREGDLRALLEQRPNSRRQWSAGAQLVLHQEATDAALHLGYDLSHDDWGLTAHRLQAQWLQPLPAGWLAALRASYYTQGAARFYSPYLVSHQAYRQVAFGSDGQPVFTNFDPQRLPAAFSSDQRLAAWGSLAWGLTLTKKLGSQLTLELGLDQTRQSGALKLGGGGQASFADLRYTVANVALRLDWAAAEGSSAPPHHSADSAAAPAGVVFAHHLPKAGEWMFGLRYVAQRDGGPLLRGSARADDAQPSAGACGPQPCALQPQAMSTRMQMLELGFGLGPQLSVMFMPQFMSMRMDQGLWAGAVPTDAAIHLGRHESAGLGDTQVHALWTLAEDAKPHCVAGLGLSAPTGSIHERHRRSHQQDGLPMDYGMQLGSGTWDLLPSLTCTGGQGAWRWGAQATATVRLQSHNSQGYALGPGWQVSSWLGYQLGPGRHATVRVVQSRLRGISGQRSEASATNSRADLAANQGGRLGELGLGFSFAPAAGGSALSAEWLQPTQQRVQGYQVARSGSLVLSWSQHF